LGARYYGEAIWKKTSLEKMTARGPYIATWVNGIQVTDWTDKECDFYFFLLPKRRLLRKIGNVG